MPSTFVTEPAKPRTDGHVAALAGFPFTGFSPLPSCTVSIMGPVRILALLLAVRPPLLFWARDKKAEEFPKEGASVRGLVRFDHLVTIL